MSVKLFYSCSFISIWGAVLTFKSFVNNKNGESKRSWTDGWLTTPGARIHILFDFLSKRTHSWSFLQAALYAHVQPYIHSFIRTNRVHFIKWILFYIFFSLPQSDWKKMLHNWGCIKSICSLGLPNTRREKERTKKKPTPILVHGSVEYFELLKSGTSHMTTTWSGTHNRSAQEPFQYQSNAAFKWRLPPLSRCPLPPAFVKRSHQQNMSKLWRNDGLALLFTSSLRFVSYSIPIFFPSYLPALPFFLLENKNCQMCDK